jgi:hypothetical protein
MDEMIELTDAELDVVAAGQDNNIGVQNNGTNNGQQIGISQNNGTVGIFTSNDILIIDDIVIVDDIVIINQYNNNDIAIEAIEGAVIGDINITNSEDKIIVSVASQDPVIGDIAFNFDNDGHMELTGFNGAGVDGGHVITFQGGANDVAVAEHDGHTTLSYGDCDLTVDAVGLVQGMDYWFLG